MHFAHQLKQACRELFVRRLPHGLISWRYLFSQNHFITFHRTIWWSNTGGWPRPLWIVLQLWLWLLWIGFRAWWSTWLVLRRLGPEVKAKEGLSLLRQARITLVLALGWCIPPSAVYRFRLYRQPQMALQFVFDHETQGFHRYNSQTLGLSSRSLRLLQDKTEQTIYLATHGIPFAQILATVPRNSDQGLECWLQPDTPLFLKTRSGSRAEGAFTASLTTTGLRGQTLNGAPLGSTQDVKQVWQKLLAHDDALVQKQLRNHPRLAAMAIGGDVITLRFITRIGGHGLACWGAILEIPVEHRIHDKQPLYVLVPIDLKTGIAKVHRDIIYPPHVQSHIVAIETRLHQIGVLPHWLEIQGHSFAAHQLFRDVYSIAWDWVITPDGPLLLEGNFGWGTGPLQVFGGGLLQARGAFFHPVSYDSNLDRGTAGRVED